MSNKKFFNAFVDRLVGDTTDIKTMLIALVKQGRKMHSQDPNENKKFNKKLDKLQKIAESLS
jgi:hypothetical protein